VQGLAFFAAPPIKANDLLRMAQWEGDNEEDSMKQLPTETNLFDALAQGLDFFGGPQMKADDLMRAALWEGDNEEDSVVVLSDVWLDQPQTFDRLRAIFGGALVAHRFLLR